MLVLTRRQDQWTYLDLPDGRRIGVLVAECRDGKVRLGFEAPADVQIVRDDAHSLRPTNGRALPAPPGPDAPQSAGNGAPRERRADDVTEAAPAAPRPGEPGYVPRTHRHHRGRA